MQQAKFSLNQIVQLSWGSETKKAQKLSDLHVS